MPNSGTSVAKERLAADKRSEDRATKETTTAGRPVDVTDRNALTHDVEPALVEDTGNAASEGEPETPERTPGLPQAHRGPF